MQSSQFLLYEYLILEAFDPGEAKIYKCNNLELSLNRKEMHVCECVEVYVSKKKLVCSQNKFSMEEEHTQQ